MVSDVSISEGGAHDVMLKEIDHTLLQDEIKECYKSFMTNDSTINKKQVLTINQIESFISTMRKSDNLFDKSVSNIDNK